jgi:Ca2+-binding EF-hand superfamily protein
MISYTEEEETQAIVEGFDKIETSLSEFGLPDTYLWIQKKDRMVNSEALNTNNVIQEITKVRQLLKTKPDDANLLTLQAKLADKLQKAHHKEVLAEVSNPLQYAVELLNLNEQELEDWVVAFQRMDKTAEGKVHIDKMFEFLNVPLTGVFKEVFHHVDAQDDENLIEFGDYMRAVAIYGFFGKDEILKFMYLYADKEKIGRITHDQFIALLGELHPHDKTRAKRALKELVMVPGKEMDFYEFKDIMCKYPALPHPMEKMQFQLRDKTMGNEWWVDKLRKYKTVRRKMEATGANIDEVAAIEMKRFGEDEARNKRMADREKAIQSEPSAVKRIILHARQIADELN